MDQPRWIPVARLSGGIGIVLLLASAVLVLINRVASAMHYVGLIVPYVALALIAFGAAAVIAELRLPHRTPGDPQPESAAGADISPSDG